MMIFMWSFSSFVFLCMYMLMCTGYCGGFDIFRYPTEVYLGSFLNFAYLFENLKNCTGLDFERGQWMKTTKLMWLRAKHSHVHTTIDTQQPQNTHKTITALTMTTTTTTTTSTVTVTARTHIHNNNNNYHMNITHVHTQILLLFGDSSGEGLCEQQLDKGWSIHVGKRWWRGVDERNQWRQHENAAWEGHQRFSRFVHFGHFEGRGKEAWTRQSVVRKWNWRWVVDGQVQQRGRDSKRTLRPPETGGWTLSDGGFESQLSSKSRCLLLLHVLAATQLPEPIEGRSVSQAWASPVPWLIRFQLSLKSRRTDFFAFLIVSITPLDLQD